MSNQRKVSKAKTQPYPALPPPPEWTPQLRMRLAREEAGLSQSDLAALLGLERKTISNWERGDTMFENIRPLWMRIMADELAVTVEWIMTGDESIPRPARREATIHDFPLKQKQVRHRRSGVTEQATGQYFDLDDEADEHAECFRGAWAGERVLVSAVS